jgi:peptidylprolyl isomerase
MASDQGKSNKPAGEPDRARMMRVLIPTVAIGVIVILAAVIAGLSDPNGARMSDGSNGTADDPGLKVIESGVKYRDLKEGNGDPCLEGGKVKVNYKGWLSDGMVFDSTKDRGPAEFELAGAGAGPGVIRGWVVGIPGMKAGGIRKLVIYPEKAYGNQKQGKIPPNSTLIFEIELISVAKTPRPRRSPAPTDLTRLADGSLPSAFDGELKTLDKGLKYRDIKVGDGPEVQKGSTAKVDYIGWTLSDGKMFDSSWKEGGRPFDANLAGGVIKGWMEGVPGMKEGGIRKLVIPPELAYGETGAGADIPPNATLVFEVEVLKAR